MVERTVPGDTEPRALEVAAPKVTAQVEPAPAPVARDRAAPTEPVERVERVERAEAEAGAGQVGAEVIEGNHGVAACLMSG
jgi:hypothetical protein